MEENNKQALQWQDELRTHKERLQQAQAVVEQETRFIAMIEGGLQYAENLKKKIESEAQQLNTKELEKSQEQKPKK